MTKEQLENYFREYYSVCFRVAFTQVKNHADAEDIVQEVFVRLLCNESKFKSKEHEKAWMIRVTLNLSKDLIKSKWHRTTIRLEKVSEIEQTYFHLPFMEEDDTLWAVLELPEKYRNCLYLFYYEDYSVKEIADILEIPENTVKTYLKRGREQLKKQLHQ